MEHPLIDKFQELINFILHKKTETIISFKRLNTDKDKVKKLNKCFKKIKEFMDYVLEGSIVGRDEDDLREEKKKGMNLSQIEEKKNPQDENSDLVTKEDLTTAKKEILNFIQTTLGIPQPQIVGIQQAIIQSEAKINTNTNLVKETLQKLIEQLQNNNNEIKQNLNNVENTVSRIIPSNSSNLTSMQGQMVSIQGKIFSKLSEQKTIIENTTERQLQGISDLNKQLKEHDDHMKQELLAIRQPHKSNQQSSNRLNSKEQAQLTQVNMILFDMFHPTDQLLESPLLVNQFKHSKKLADLVIICDNTNIVVAGCSNYFKENLNLYKNDGKLIKSSTLGFSMINCGITIKNQLYIHVNNSITIFDQLTLANIKEVKIQSNANKLYLHNEIIFVGQMFGCLDIINVISNETIMSNKLDYDSIYDIISIHNNYYAFACRKGLCIYKINNDYSIDDQYVECYLEEQYVQSIQYVNDNILIAGVKKNKQLQIINRQEKQVIKQIDGFDGEYSCIQRIIGYDDNNYPYLIIKDNSNIIILNTHTFEIAQIIKCEYNQCANDSLIQKQEDQDVCIYTIHNQVSEEVREVKQKEETKEKYRDLDEFKKQEQNEEEEEEQKIMDYYIQKYKIAIR